jgi:hypothetical protein
MVSSFGLGQKHSPAQLIGMHTTFVKCKLALTPNISVSVTGSNASSVQAFSPKKTIDSAVSLLLGMLGQ